MIEEDYSLKGQLAKTLNDSLDSLNISISDAQVEQLLVLLKHLYQWNKAYNLTAIKKPAEGLRLHIIDSLTLVSRFKQLSNQSQVLDVGTGPGFPGLPLAIVFPELKFSLLDSNSKKIRFIRQVIHELGVNNVEPIHSRVEALNNREFDVVTSRAFASLTDMVKLTQPLMAKNGVWLAMKGDFSNAELDELPADIIGRTVTAVEIPGLRTERCIIELNKEI